MSCRHLCVKGSRSLACGGARAVVQMHPQAPRLHTGWADAEFQPALIVVGHFARLPVQAARTMASLMFSGVIFMCASTNRHTIGTEFPEMEACLRWGEVGNRSGGERLKAQLNGLGRIPAGLDGSGGRI